jgi:hypothetical protein
MIPPTAAPLAFVDLCSDGMLLKIADRMERQAAAVHEDRRAGVLQHAAQLRRLVAERRHEQTTDATRRRAP